jgi:hypothetical protein
VLVGRICHGGDEPGDDLEFVLGGPVHDGGVLAPALVALLGRANWWQPRPTARLLHTTPLTTRGAYGRAGQDAGRSAG